MLTTVRIAEGYDPFSLHDFDSTDHPESLPSPALLMSCGKILSSNPIVRAEGGADLITPFLLEGLWGFLWGVEKRMLGLFINAMVERTVGSGKILQRTADFSCLAYGLAVSNALHTDDRRGKGTFLASLWGRLRHGTPMAETVEQRRRPIFERIPPTTTAIVQVFLLNLNRFDRTLSDTDCDHLLQTFDFADFSKLNRPFEGHLACVGGRSLPDLLLSHHDKLKAYLDGYRALACGGYFVDRLDHYQKREWLVPSGYLRGDFD